MGRPWLLDGNPAPGHDMIWAQANGIVFLDYA
ncbi:hypothetical protein N836_19160 [Leptolyngbya sp. Heron Island J]|nr:hypothetical protein N836_19160 [Leptolyngbya sp. Heron Island J]